MVPNTKWQKTGTGLIVASIVIVLWGLFYFVWHKDMQVDEAESFTGASLIFNGQVPYKDFWQIHTPLFYYLLVPLCLFFKTMKIIYAARIVTFFLLLLNGYLIYFIAKQFFSKKAGLLGFLAYFTCSPILILNARPDVLVCLFSNLSLLLLLWPRLAASKSFFLCGLSAALALLSKQSGVFCIFSIIIFFILRSSWRNEECWDKEIFSKERFNIRNYGFFALGLLLPCLGFYVLLLSQGAWDDFLKCAVKNDFLNLFLFLKVKSSHYYPNAWILAMFCVNSLLFFSTVALAAYVICFRKQVDRKRLNSFVLIFIFFAVAFGSLFKILHASRYELLLDCQYLVLLSIPLMLFVYEAAFNFFARRNNPVVGLIVEALMLLCLWLPPVFHVYKTIGPHLPISIRGYDQIIALTNKGDKCFSVVPIPFRRSVYFYHIGEVLVEAPKTKAWVENTLIKEILHESVLIIVPDVRYQDMKRLMYVINNNYVKRGYPFYIPGKIFDIETCSIYHLNILVEGYYKIETNGASILIDKRPVTDSVIYLGKGEHAVYFDNQGICLAHGKTCRIFYDLQANKKSQ